MNENQESYTSRRLVLRDWGDDEAIRLGESGGWRVLRNESSENPLGITRTITWSLAPGIALTYLADGRSGCSVLVVSGSQKEAVQRFQKSLEESLNPWTLGELTTTIDKAQTVPEIRAAILRAGIGSPQEYNRKFFKRINRAMSSDNPGIRFSGIWATAYSRWPEFREDLSNIAQKDPVESLRVDARIILDHYDDGRS
ncbi:hypothetical protein [Streptomyces sp. NPDC001985]|uniref:hypothetical protein n=1 Tax=Streptomyces sp. NPDC001985 TaxID=3154406 RepID=UPI00331E33CF